MTVAPVQLTATLASRLANAALGHIGREYPTVLVQVMSGPEDASTPRSLHPIFFGSFDWHSCVHAHWMLARLLRLYPALAEAETIRSHFDQALTPPKVAGERAYLQRPGHAGFERPYGWAWLLKLAAELEDGAAGRWGVTLQPLARDFADRFKAYLPKADYPVRAGVHSNTAFALLLADDYAQAAGDVALRDLVRGKARAWYGLDADCQAWEPSGDDFLSPALIEALLMRRCLAPEAFQAWFAAFLPHAGESEPATLFHPARVSDRSDGKIAHLDGLNLSRAWCWQSLAGGLAAGDPVAAVARAAADRHLSAGLGHVTGDYMGEHWLASFALLALEA